MAALRLLPHKLRKADDYNMNTWNIGIIGGGKMGVGIGQLFATKGYSVTVIYVGNDKERNDSAKNMRANLAFLAENGVVDAGEIDTILSRVTYTEDFQAIANADIVFECIVENLNVKQDMFQKLDSICGPNHSGLQHLRHQHHGDCLQIRSQGPDHWHPLLEPGLSDPAGGGYPHRTGVRSDG